ncbi:uncharacterized protein MYCGRDRAFT_88619 [Zymoseptoria tritici IPO323]|uniref:Secreted protein n=1 Tax=Zymoseptoria tritici (strain CBS 115943 / IPO323) TaxID=336722 RepID=F9WXE9_ZYMTI|nr:uncharacterized protein MYCGRDRAFT_88619 [Zymoseptoria tritici IPO323]EGP90822.1 hypothetical protein MYCGRDRAFT_88619 [Zymoseptoria tritici IPO323]
MWKKVRITALCSIFAFSLFTQARSLNLTIVFSLDGLETCAYPSNASEADGITFTTSSIPVNNQCFNLNEIFQGPNTGVVTQDSTSFPFMDGVSNVTYAVSNQAAFDPTMNYSRIYYEQSYPGSPSRDTQDTFPDNTATRILTLFSDQDCRNAINETGPVGQRVLPCAKTLRKAA